MGYRYIVFGAGRQGTCAIYDLIQNCEAESIHVVDPDAAALKVAKDRLETLLSGHAGFDITYAETATPDDLSGAAVALSCAPYRVNADLTELSLKANVPFCDLGGNPNIVAKQQLISNESCKDIPVVPDCGISPGLSNILAVHLAIHERTDRIRVRCGGIPVTEKAVKNELKYQIVFSPEGLLSEYSGDVPVIRDGKVTTIPALSCVEPFDGGRYEAAPTSNNSPQVVDYLLSIGVREYDYMTLRYPGHWSIARGWQKDGSLGKDVKKRAELAKKLGDDTSLQYDPEKHRDRLILSLEGTKPGLGSSDDFRTTVGFKIDLEADRITKFSAMEMLTAWGITIVAYSLAKNAGSMVNPHGFATPERFMDTEWTIQELARRISCVAR